MVANIFFIIHLFIYLFIYLFIFTYNAVFLLNFQMQFGKIILEKQANFSFLQLYLYFHIMVICYKELLIKDCKDSVFYEGHIKTMYHRIVYLCSL